MKDIVDRRLRDCPGRYRGIYCAAINGKASPRQAIKAMCYGCMGWEGKGGVLAEVESCTSYACPLHAYRPRVKGSQVAGAEGLAVPEPREGIDPTLELSEEPTPQNADRIKSPI